MKIFVLFELIIFELIFTDLTYAVDTVKGLELIIRRVFLFTEKTTIEYKLLYFV